jgi:excisionase family DNA binding protein
VTEARLLSPNQAAAYLGLGSRWAIYRLVKSGQLAAVPIAGKLRVDRQDLERLIEAKKCEASTRPTPVAAYRSPALGAPRGRLAPLAPRNHSNGDRTVTADAKVRVAVGHPGRHSDVSSVFPVAKEGH